MLSNFSLAVARKPINNAPHFIKNWILSQLSFGFRIQLLVLYFSLLVDCDRQIIVFLHLFL